MTRNLVTTDELIARLASAPPPKPFAPALLAALVLGAVGLGVVVWLSLMGLRPDLGAALRSPPTLAKTLLPALLAGLALWLAARSGYPERGLRLACLFAPVPIALILFGSAWSATPASLVADAVIGSTAIKCLSAVLALSALPIIGGMIGMRDGASTRPAVTGALLGLAAGAGAAAGYSLGCTEDSPLFYVVWYGLAILCAGGIGALLGSRMLKW